MQRSNSFASDLIFDKHPNANIIFHITHHYFPFVFVTIHNQKPFRCDWYKHNLEEDVWYLLKFMLINTNVKKRLQTVDITIMKG